MREQAHRRWRRRVALAAASALGITAAVACGKLETPAQAPQAEKSRGMLDEQAPAAPQAAPAPESESSPMAGYGGIGKGAGSGAARRPAARDEGGAPEAAPKPARMVHYNGYLKLRSTEPAQTLQQASELADRLGGYVESLTAAAVTLRVPVAKFKVAYEEVAKLAEVLSRSMTAQDVTDAYVAMSLRVEILEASRDRLIALLARATKTHEKLRLLAEIRRLTEEIDRLQMYLTTLASLAELSRLSVEVVPYELHVASAGDEPVAAFRWIHQLSPFRRDIAAAGDVLALRAPAGMVELSDAEIWTAESADGAVVWASTQPNEPRGSSAYWLAAIRDRLAPEYGDASVSTVGDYEVLRLVDQSERAYRYLVGVRAHGDELEVVEVYFPGEEQEQRYGAAVATAIQGGEA